MMPALIVLVMTPVVSDRRAWELLIVVAQSTRVPRTYDPTRPGSARPGCTGTPREKRLAFRSSEKFRMAYTHSIRAAKRKSRIARFSLKGHLHETPRSIPSLKRIPRGNRKVHRRRPGEHTRGRLVQELSKNWFDSVRPSRPRIIDHSARYSCSIENLGRNCRVRPIAPHA